MSYQTEGEVIQKINDLHSEILGGCERIILNAIQIEELLAEQKNRLKPRKWGEWVRWVQENLIFKENTAHHYSIVFSGKHLISRCSENRIEQWIKFFANRQD